MEHVNIIMEAATKWITPEQSLGLAPLPDIIGAATPLFFPLMAVELLASKAVRRKVYSLRQTINNLSAGVLTVLLGIFLKALFVFPYHAIHTRWGWGHSAPAAAVPWWSQCLALLFCDFAFYWFHRTCHATNLGWSAHVVHHTSPDFNLSTALRQGAGESTFSWLFYLPLALACPLPVFALHRGLNTVYQFFVHTELVGKLWWPLELVLNTPSHHRVHHARNYGRRNFGGLLIVWDRLFGTFQEESQGRGCIYGLDSRARPLGTFNSLWHQVQHLWCTLRLAVTQGPILASLFTRKYGAGMVRPSTTDAEPPGEGKSKEPGNARSDPSSSSAGGARPAGSSTCATAPPAIKRGAVAVPPAATQASQKQPKLRAGRGVLTIGAAGAAEPPYLWDPRPLGVLDYYAAAHFFGTAIPLSLLVLEAARRLGALSTLSAGAMAAGAAWAALTVASLGQLLDGSQRAVYWELLRLGMQIAVLKAAIWRGPLQAGLPLAAAWGAGAVLSLSLVLLVGQLVMIPPSASVKVKGT